MTRAIALPNLIKMRSPFPKDRTFNNQGDRVLNMNQKDNDDRTFSLPNNP